MMGEPGDEARVEEVAEAFSAIGWKYRRRSGNALQLSFGGREPYRNTSGEPVVRVIVDFREKRMRFYAPMAWRVPAGGGAAVFETCLRLQWRYFGIIFEFDHHDGELRAAYEFLRDMFPAATLVPAYVRNFLRLLDTVHPAIDAAIRDGVVYEDRPEPQSPVLGEVIEKLGELSPEQLRLLLAALREEVPA